MAEEYRHKAVSIVTQAIEADNDNRTKEAFDLYMKAFEWFELTLKYEKNPKTAECIKRRMLEYIERAEQLKGRQMPHASGASVSPLDSTILIETPNVTWDQVAGLDEAIFTLKESVIMPVRFPYIFSAGGLKPWKGILLYGPPGTGKSFLAKAIATEAKGTFFSVSAADIVSKWVGESERMVKSLFDMARARKPAIIFIDEIESLCGQRDQADSSQASSRLISEILSQMEGVGRDQDGVLVLAATNLPWAIDMAVRRRFQQRIYIPLPNAVAREKMFRTHGITKHLRKLVRLSEGYSGADIAVAVNKARMGAIRKIQTATHFKRLTGPSPLDPNVSVDDLLTPCSPGDEGAMEMDWMSVPHGKLVVPPVDDYVTSVEATRPTVQQKDLERYEEWTRELGILGE